LSGIGWRVHLPLIRSMMLLICILLLFGWGLNALGANAKHQPLDHNRWQWSPAASFQDLSPPLDNWVPFDAAHELISQNDQYWLRIPLPADHQRDPQLLVSKIVAIRAFDGNEQIYAYDPHVQGHRINLFMHWNLVPLPDPIPAEVYLLLDNRGDARPIPSVELVGKGAFYISLLRQDSYQFVLSALFLFAAATAFGVFAVRRTWFQFYVGLLSLYASYGSLVRNRLLQFFWDQPWFGYIDLALFPLGIYAFLSVLDHVFPGANARLRPFRQVLLVFVVIVLAGSILLPEKLYNPIIGYPLLLMFLATAFIVFQTLQAAYRMHRRPDAVWMLTGSIVVVVFALIHAIQVYFPVAYDKIVEYVPAIVDAPYDRLSVSLFLFQICLIRVILYRFGVMNEQLQHIGDFLERSVRARTAELEQQSKQLQQTYARLAQTTQETAETMASAMVLDERNRLTGKIHDTVGHALTATIIQLEAARRLLDRDARLAMDKLVATQELIRKGLGEIRQSTGLIRNDSSSYNLEEAIIGLVMETEQSTDTKFDLQLDKMPPSLTDLQKKVIFQALQEGITNGLRHGRSTRFHFSLKANPSMILFRLESNGETYSPSEYGFGLKVMAERVSQLGGAMTVEPGHPGCVLHLSLPYRDSHSRAMKEGQ